MGYVYLELADFLLIAEVVLGVPAETLARSDRIVALTESALAGPDPVGWLLHAFDTAGEC